MLEDSPMDTIESLNSLFGKAVVVRDGSVRVTGFTSGFRRLS